LLGPDQSARGLAQSKTLARMTMAFVNAKRLGLRWPSTAFPKDVSSPPHSFQEIKALYNLWQHPKNRSWNGREKHAEKKWGNGNRFEDSSRVTCEILIFSLRSLGSLAAKIQME
jgi:hypothetical protein